ncbi:MAG TPA: helix-turn-helix domain-containing protein, partial [Flavisolibacter sp.]
MKHICCVFPKRWNRIQINMNLKELARKLNISTSTVSKALRDSHEISEATKKRVRAKAKELNYQVNP